MKRYKSIVFTFLKKTHPMEISGERRGSMPKQKQYKNSVLLSRTGRNETTQILEYFIYDVVGTKIRILIRTEK